MEEAYDEILRGVDGSRDVIVNSHGKEVGVMGQELATPGQDLRLTIDLDVQMAAERALDGKHRRTSSPWTRTPARSSPWPRAPPSIPTSSLCASPCLLGRPSSRTLIHPLLNKTIQAQLAPGSTFKIIMSLAGLQENVAQDPEGPVQRRRHLLRPLPSPATATTAP